MLYHYTTIEALFSIIEQIRTETDIDECGRRNEHWVLPLRATHIGFLNDSTEGSLLTHALAGMKVSQEAVKSAVLQNGKQYVLSFSKKKDDLNMWRSYSDDGYGVMLGFDRDGLEKHVNELYKNDNPMSLAMPVVDCEYIDNEEISAELAGEKDLEDYRAKGNAVTGTAWRTSATLGRKVLASIPEDTHPGSIYNKAPEKVGSFTDIVLL